jgi:hypothetical protein
LTTHDHTGRTTEPWTISQLTALGMALMGVITYCRPLDGVNFFVQVSGLTAAVWLGLHYGVAKTRHQIHLLHVHRYPALMSAASIKLIFGLVVAETTLFALHSIWGTLAGGTPHSGLWRLAVAALSVIAMAGVLANITVLKYEYHQTTEH